MYKIFENGYAGVKLNGKYGVVDKKKNEVIPCKYDKVEYINLFKDRDYVEVTLNEKKGVVDKQGNEVVPCKYNDISMSGIFKDGYAKVKLNGKNYLVDKQGIQYNEDYKKEFENYGFALATKNDKMGIVDVQGKEIVPFKYDNIENFREGFAKVKLNNKYGFISKSGSEIIPVKYDYIDNFSEEAICLAKAELNHNIVYIDKITGKEVTNIDYIRAAITEKQRQKESEQLINTLERMIAELGAERRQEAEAARKQLEQLRSEQQQLQQQQQATAAAQQRQQQQQKQLQIQQGLMQIQQSLMLMNNTFQQSNQRNNTNTYQAPSSTTNQSATRTTCTNCNGEGKLHTETPQFGLGDPKWCDKCKKEVSAGHCHGCKLCPVCNGKGYW